MLDPSVNHADFLAGTRTRVYRDDSLIPEKTLITSEELPLEQLVERMGLEAGDVIYTADFFFLLEDDGRFSYLPPAPDLEKMYREGINIERKHHRLPPVAW